jgi:hypothetical protein
MTRNATYDKLKAMAFDAMPINDADWGSERQLDAEHDFFAEAEHCCGEFSDDFANWALKATTDEYIKEAMRIIAQKLGMTEG